MKVGTMALTIAAGWVAQKAVATIWEKSTGHAAPKNSDDEEVTIVQAVTFAAVSAAVAVLARRLAHQAASRAGTRSTASGDTTASA
jgi:hypothetical protein